MDYKFLLIAVHVLIAIDGKKLKRLNKINLIYQNCGQSGFTLTCNYIPKEIPDNVTAVRIENNNIDCNNETFLSKTWSRVIRLEMTTLNLDEQSNQALNLESKCFYPLQELEQLYLHSENIHISEMAFIGLDKLQLLDFTGCARLRMTPLQKALHGKTKMPSLTEISLSKASIFIDGEFIQFDTKFFSALGDKPITKIEAMKTQVSIFNLTHMFALSTQLKDLNVSESIIDHAYIHGLTKQNSHTKLRSMDASYTTVPSDFLPPGSVHIKNRSFSFDDIYNRLVAAILSTKILNLTGIITNRNAMWVENVTLSIKKPLTLTVQEIILNENNLRRLNCHVFSNSSIPSLTRIALNNNLMDYMHPSLMALVPNLNILELSGNRLNKMAKENYEDFVTFLHPLKRLKKIDLSNNGLEHIPSKFFQVNSDLEIINLSGNNLQHVTFDLIVNKHLQMLNLQKNNITRLDEISLNKMNPIIHHVATNMSAKMSINLQLNPITCDTCHDKTSIEWLLKAKRMKAIKHNLQCWHNNEHHEYISDKTLENIQGLCRRKSVILVSSFATGSILLVVLITSIIVYQRRKIKRKLKQRQLVLKNLKTGEDKYKFVAFLGYSSDDENFVQENVINQMNETLQELTGINRNLVCTGDQCFRPGHMVHDEIATCLERVCTMVILVTDSYCSSSYCCNEFDQAYLHRKPIILMIRGNVNVEIMPPAMKRLYQMNARILWAEENGEYILKTNWENVCSSILDLIK